jgi:hypothetical protein
MLLNGIYYIFILKFYILNININNEQGLKPIQLNSRKIKGFFALNWFEGGPDRFCPNQWILQRKFNF